MSSRQCMACGYAEQGAAERTSVFVHSYFCRGREYLCSTCFWWVLGMVDFA